MTTTEKNNVVSHHVWSAQGVRFEMEDTDLAIYDLLGDQRVSLFAVFDGHGGAQVSDYLKKHYASHLIEAFKSIKEPNNYEGALRISFRKCDEALSRTNVCRGGSTAVVALLVDQKHLYVANCGDSEAILLHRDCADVQCLTEVHKPTVEKERQRILEAGGFVVFGRVSGTLAVSRSFGDFEYVSEMGLRKELVIATPHIYHCEVAPNDAVVLACDGLWDVVNYQDAANEIRKMLLSDESSVFATPQNVAQRLVQMAIEERNSQDNVSVIVVKILPAYEAQQQRKPTMSIFSGTTNICWADIADDDDDDNNMIGCDWGEKMAQTVQQQQAQQQEQQQRKEASPLPLSKSESVGSDEQQQWHVVSKNKNQRQCVVCRKFLNRQKFSFNQWNHKRDEECKCKRCIAAYFAEKDNDK